MELPEWMGATTEYVPARDREGFLTRSLLKLLGLLERFRENGSKQSGRVHAGVRLAGTLLLILLTALARNSFFVWCVLALLLARLCFLPGKALRSVLKGAVAAAAFSALVLLPAVFWGQPRSLLTVSSKVFVSVGLLGVLSATTPWHRLTAALGRFHVPGLVVFLLDVTLKYIQLLGEVCVNALTALRLRSVGRDRAKERSFSGVLGVTFLRSKEMEDELFDAMRCRGFDGEYRTARREPFTGWDALALVFLAAMTALFLYLEGGMRG